MGKANTNGEFTYDRMVPFQDESMYYFLAEDKFVIADD